MTSDDQHFLDILSSIPNDILRYSSSVTNAFERSFDEASIAVRERLSTATWLPAAARPKPPPPPISIIPLLDAYRHDSSNIFWRSYAWTVDWVDRNRAISAAVLTFVGTGGWLLYRQRKAYARKRRARRGPGGARKEVVVVAGSPSSPLPWSVVLDLERRGFVVYVVVNSSREVELVKNEAKSDIIPLHIHITDPTDIENQIQHFTRLFPVSSSSNTSDSSNTFSALSLTGLILIPDLAYPSGPIETIPPNLWSDALNAKILLTIATTQAFLRPLRTQKSRILLLTPTIISSLAPPFHGIENTVVAALSGFAASLTSELATVGVEVCHLKLGTFDSAHLFGGGQGQHGQRGQPHPLLIADDVTSWASAQQAAYGGNYTHQATRATVPGLFSSPPDTNAAAARGVRGTPLRELHNAVFDALKSSRPSPVWRVGRGSLVYELMGRWAPAGLVTRMMGLRMVDGAGGGRDGKVGSRHEAEEGKEEEEEAQGEGEGMVWEKVERIH